MSLTHSRVKENTSTNAQHTYEHTLTDEGHRTLAAIQKPDANPGSNQPKAVWSKALDLGTVYQFGIVINTSQSQGFLQVYFNGKLITMTDPYTGEKTQKLAGNFFPGGDQGAADPKIGMYGGNDVVDDGYIYDFVLADSLADIKSVAGIA
jgi:hypothetical protein